jgi:protein SCO1/2/putative membrane protein
VANVLHLAVWVIALASFAWVAAWPALADQVQVPKWDPQGIEDFEFTECRGRTVTKNDLLGQPWLACFVFTQCAGPCPLVSARMQELQRATAGLPVRLVTLTVDPQNDTPEVLRRYADQLGADPDRWWFLTGDKAAIHRLIRRSFRMIVQEVDPEHRIPGFQVEHSIEIMHVDANGVVIGRYLAKNDVHMDRLRKVLLGQMTADEAQRLNAADQLAQFATAGGDTPDNEDLPPDELAQRGVPAWLSRLPAINAGLNALALVLLLLGLVLIKRRRVQGHKLAMLMAFVTSSLFLATYLVYHFGLHHFTGVSSRRFEGPAVVRPFYYFLLATHVVLAAAVPVLALVTIYRGLTAQWERHRQIARITLPVWLYVSVTGVIIYFVLYHL